MTDQGESESEMTEMNDHWQRFKVFLEAINERHKTVTDENTDKAISTIKQEIKAYTDEYNINDEEKLVKENKFKEAPKGNSDSETSSEDQRSKKKTRKKRKEKLSSEDTDDQSTSSDSSTSESDSNDKKKKSLRYRKKNSEAENTRKLLTKLDTRKILDLPMFEEYGNVNLHEYISMFEEHYEANYKGSRKLWINELEKYLSGNILEYFLAIKQNETRYKKIKEKLTKWYDDENENRKRKAKRTFEKCKMKDEETSIMFSNRLLTNFKRAYPKKNCNKSETLISKFLKTIPRKLREKLDNQILNYKLKNKKMTFDKIQRIVAVLDVNEEHQEEEEDIIRINLAKHNGNDKKLDNDRKWDRDYKLKNKSNLERDPQTSPDDHYGVCSYCKRYGHNNENCRKRLRTCFKCGNFGHFVRDCKLNNKMEHQRNRTQSESPKRNYNRNSGRNASQPPVQMGHEYRDQKRNEESLNSQPPAEPRNSWRGEN